MAHETAKAEHLRGPGRLVELSRGSRSGTAVEERRSAAVHPLSPSGRAPLAIVPASGPSSTPYYSGLVGQSEAYHRLVATLRRLETSTANVLLEGESGTGKEVVARAIHHHSAFGAGPFVAVNCGALDANLLRSELFGHERGAFTGAVRSNVGAFVAAAAGTLFLDEIGELPLEIQPALLRALEERCVTPVGAQRERQVTARLIFATNRDLEQEVAARRFRVDLFYRIHVLRVRLPPLRERADDVETLARMFAHRFGVGTLSEEILRTLRRREWPGNIRELRNAIEALSVLGTLPAPFAGLEGTKAHCGSGIELERSYAAQKAEVIESFSRTYLERLLEHTRGNVSSAARLSGLDRNYLARIARKLGVRAQ